LRCDAKLVRWPDHYTDERGEAMWKLVCELMDPVAGGNAEQLPRMRHA
jgi:hypothetical protein